MSGHELIPVTWGYGGITACLPIKGIRLTFITIHTSEPIVVGAVADGSA